MAKKNHEQSMNHWLFIAVGLGLLSFVAYYIYSEQQSPYRDIEIQPPPRTATLPDDSGEPTLFTDLYQSSLELNSSLCLNTLNQENSFWYSLPEFLSLHLEDGSPYEVTLREYFDEPPVSLCYFKGDLYALSADSSAADFQELALTSIALDESQELSRIILPATHRPSLQAELIPSKLTLSSTIADNSSWSFFIANQEFVFDEVESCTLFTEEVEETTPLVEPESEPLAAVDRDPSTSQILDCRLVYELE